tara:strand:+ start:526 stop:705 length:180 start_codon:yes stop_codon:yes gene_type:complete
MKNRSTTPRSQGQKVNQFWANWFAEIKAAEKAKAKAEAADAKALAKIVSPCTPADILGR